MKDWTNIENFTNKELIEELDIRGCSEVVDYELDVIDQEKLTEIINKFCDSSWIDREAMYKSVCS